MSQHMAPRRKRAYLGTLATTQLHLRTPYIVALWSAVLPGFGHLLLSMYLHGIFLIIWETIINIKSNLNVAIFYTFTGKFELAKQSLDTRWFLIYIPTYLFAIWDSYRNTTALNKQYILAVRENAPVTPFAINQYDISYMDKNSPTIAALWAIFSPGISQFIFRRFFVAVFFTAWWTLIIYKSHILPAIHYTLCGNFKSTQNILALHWALNIPSVYLFSIYDSYINTIESNRLFEWEQSRALKHEYQNGAFEMPVKKADDNGMYIITSFEHSIKLEMAVTALQEIGIPKEQILAAPLEKQENPMVLKDHVQITDNANMIDIPMIMATIFALFGLINGFNWRWGPVLWALIGCGVGFGIGLLIKILTLKHEIKKRKEFETQVILMISCSADQADAVKKLLWEHQALGVSRLNLGGSE